tara:strand:- start:2294 stop:2662 length:369 start_codon:yes stop_codon:yes gene_type:complete
MKLFDKLTNKNFKLYAAQHYNNPECVDVEEFQQDLNRFKYLKRLLKRYELTGDLQERLILNHLIVLYNCFGIEAGNRMIWFKINEEHWHYIKPFLVYLHYLPEEEQIDIVMDPYIVQTLREL